MLPDFVQLKGILGQRIRASIQQDAMDDPLLSEIAHHRIHEGDRFTMFRQDGSVETSRFRRMEASVQVSAEEIRTAGVEAIRKAQSDLAEQFQEASAKLMLDTIQRATDEVGNVVHGGGRPFTAELALEVFEKMEFSFGPDGAWKRQSLVVHPSMAERTAKELERLDREPDLKAKMDALITRKREEWHVREAYRKLVD